ncbi:hypothetical protein MMC11_006767 [Xylographa trunciseda]|nr:hypothetical protein [Xylographa trunciseda]
MAEIGLIASVVGVAGAGVKLSLTLREFACEVHDAGRNIHDIASSVSVFSTTLTEVKRCIQSSTSPHSDSALDTIEEIVGNCKRIFREIRSMIKLVRNDAHSTRKQQPVSLGQRFRWVFKKGKVRYLTGQLESSKATLSLMLQTIQLRITLDENRQTREEVETRREEVERLQAEIQTLILDRVWAQRKVDACGEDGEPAKDDSSTDQEAEGSESSGDISHGSDDDTKAMVRFQPDSLAALDLTLSDANPKAYNISWEVVSRSSQAVNYLLDRWTVESLPKAFDSWQQDDDKSPKSKQKMSSRTSLVPETLALLPVPTDQFSLYPTRDFADNFCDWEVKWGIDCQKYIELCQSHQGFRWTFVVGDLLFDFLSDHFLFQTKLSHDIPSGTYLASEEFTFNAISTLGKPAGKMELPGQYLDPTQSPFTKILATPFWHIPRILQLHEVTRVWTIPIIQSDKMSTAQYIEHLRCLRILETLGRGSTIQHANNGISTGTATGKHTMPPKSEEELLKKAEKSSTVPQMRQAQTFAREAPQNAGIDRRAPMPPSAAYANGRRAYMLDRGSMSGGFDKGYLRGGPDEDRTFTSPRTEGDGSSQYSVEDLSRSFFGAANMEGTGNDDMFNTQGGADRTRRPRMSDRSSGIKHRASIPKVATEAGKSTSRFKDKVKHQRWVEFEDEDDDEELNRSAPPIPPHASSTSARPRKVRNPSKKHTRADTSRVLVHRF